MKITLKKAVCHDDAFWNVGSTIEAEKNFALYAIGLGDAVEAAKDEPLTPRPDSGPERRSLETVAMEKAASAIVGAIAQGTVAAKKGAKGDA